MNTSSTAEAARYRDRPRPQQLPGGPHGLSRAEVVASQRNRLLQAMVELVGERGYAETSVRDVTDRAGVSRKTFYELFPTRNDCLYAVYDEAAQCLRGVVQHAYENGVTAQERIDAAVNVMLEWVGDEPDLARVCMLEVPTSGIAGQRRLTATLSWLSSVMADVLGDLDVPEVLPELLIGGVHQMIVHRLVNDADDMPALGTDLSEVWVDLERRAA
ncbi:MAG TPA: TetR/AcrR family transcriptional regulator [Thermoleophilaceae bacterium]|nr:TetR/AcrR family transcriptional regulator [Thermoleophilaceae bacterium]